jgi:hypothetical protein
MNKTIAFNAALFASGAFAAPAYAAQTVDIAATPSGTAIDLVGDTTAEYYFYSSIQGSAPELQAKLASGNLVGPVSQTPYYPGANAAGLEKDQDTSVAGYYGLRFFDDNNQAYTGYALVDNTGKRITEIDFRAAGVPEPATWALLMLGFGGVGAAMRHRRRAGRVAAAA